MGTLQRPKCALCKEKDGWIFMAGQWICGDCMAEWDKECKESAFNQMKEVLGK